MTIELIGSVAFFILTTYALLFSMTKASRVGSESFPNRGRFFGGLTLWMAAAILGVFMSFPGYVDWFVPLIYPVLKISFLILFLAGFFMILTTAVAFPIHINYFREEIDGRSDRIALLENIRQIAGQPCPVPETFTLALRELASFLVTNKGAVFLTNPSRREMYMAAQIGLDRSELKRLERFAIGQDIISRAASEQVSMISGDLKSSDQASRKLLLSNQTTTISAAVVPLVARDRSLGALLVLSDKPFRFEKRDRMLLNAAAEALAGVVESNRLVRENQKLTRSVEDQSHRLNSLRYNLKISTDSEDRKVILGSICRYLTERYNGIACRIIKSSDGNLEETASFGTITDFNGGNQSYRIAVIEGIIQNKMVILNQEAKDAEGNTSITRSTLLCPIAVPQSGEYALLMEAAGGSLAMSESFLADVESMVNLAEINLTISELKEDAEMNRLSVKSLLNIFKIGIDVPEAQMFKNFIDEISGFIHNSTSAMIFIRDPKKGYRFLHGYRVSETEIADTVFLPGEGPIGKSAAAGEILNYSGCNAIEEAWSDLEVINRDFLNRGFGEMSRPDFQMNIPINVLEEVVAVMSVFCHGTASSKGRKEKGVLLLAAQLLSIKLSLSRLNERLVEGPPGSISKNMGTILNRINNDLATVLGRAQLLARQSDISGRTRYTTDEIVSAAESAAATVKRLQEDIIAGGEISFNDTDPLSRLDSFLSQRHVTGNLYMLDDNRPIMLQKEIDREALTESEFVDLYPALEETLIRFVKYMDEGDEILVDCQRQGSMTYFGLMRGSREKLGHFNPLDYEFGDADVLPAELSGESVAPLLGRYNAQVSFDRFGKQPTYLIFRFQTSEKISKSEPITATGSESGKLKILAIDDQQMILDLLSGICNSLGMEILAVRDPARGIEILRSQIFDIVMIDLAMGSISGWEIAREAKKYSPRTPVIMMTGWGINLSQDEYRKNGVDFTLAKPFKIEQLMEIIDHAREKRISS